MVGLELERARSLGCIALLTRGKCHGKALYGFGNGLINGI